MIQRYDINYNDLCFHENENGDWVMWDDIQDLINSKIASLKLEEDCVITIAPPEGVRWNPNQCYYMSKSFEHVFEGIGIKNWRLYFQDSGMMVGSHKSN